MRSRRDFFKLGFLAPLGAVKLDDGYEPAGFVSADDFHAVDIVHVTLDGVRVEHVFEANDVEGWVRVYVYRGDGSPTTRARYLTGTVRYVYRSQ